VKRKVSELQLRFDFSETDGQPVSMQPVTVPLVTARSQHCHLKLWFENPRKPEMVLCLGQPKRIDETDLWSTQHVGHAKGNCWICARGGIVTAKEYFSSPNSGCWHPKLGSKRESEVRDGG
jgi:hypothetical protein